MELSCAYWLIPLANAGMRGGKRGGVALGHGAPLSDWMPLGLSSLRSADTCLLILVFHI